MTRNTKLNIGRIGGVALIYSALAVLVFAKPIDTRLDFMTHLDASFPEQDVFVVKSGFPSNEVFRVEADDALDSGVLGGQAYASAGPVEHDPFKLGESPLGPFPRGTPLGFTLEEWLTASGAGTYTVDGEKAELNLSFESLVPSGLYTVWCSRITLPPDPSVIDAPCGDAEGSENIVSADAEGRADYSIEMNALLPSTDEVISVIALAYHSDGKTYGASPGDFGSKTHVQIFSMIPPPRAGSPGGIGDGTVLLWVFIGILVVVAIVHFVTRVPRSPSWQEPRSTANTSINKQQK